jgi:hypothetical protein
MHCTEKNDSGNATEAFNTTSNDGECLETGRDETIGGKDSLTDEASNSRFWCWKEEPTTS